MSNVSFDRPVFLAQIKTPAKPVCKELDKFSDNLEMVVSDIEIDVIKKKILPNEAAKLMLKIADKTTIVKYLNLRILNNQYQVEHANNPRKSECAPPLNDALPSAKEIRNGSQKYIEAEKAILKSLETIDKKPSIIPLPSSMPKHYPRRISSIV